MIRESFKLGSPLQDIFPDSFKNSLNGFDNVEFRNLDHFRFTVSKLTQKNDDYCDVTYKKALDDLMRGNSLITTKEFVDIQNLVKSNLHKRGLITEEVYENYRYATNGTQVGVDVAKYAAGEPDCVMVPNVQYVDFFYELYISISYPYNISNKQVRENLLKLLSTVEELERQHVYIKITLVLPIRNVTKNNGNFFSSIPLFSHRETKDAFKMSSVLNDRLLRKFYFAVIEDLYGKDIAYGYGNPVDMDDCMNIGDKFNEIEFFELVMNSVKP